jgi:hypothetical protein
MGHIGWDGTANPVSVNVLRNSISVIAQVHTAVGVSLASTRYRHTYATVMNNELNGISYGQITYGGALYSMIGNNYAANPIPSIFSDNYGVLGGGTTARSLFLDSGSGWNTNADYVLLTVSGTTDSNNFTLAPDGTSWAGNYSNNQVWHDFSMPWGAVGSGSDRIYP